MSALQALVQTIRPFNVLRALFLRILVRALQKICSQSCQLMNAETMNWPFCDRSGL